ncbi:AmmeMemoRadiSam system protein B [Thermodesulfobacteriota bacterium]
MLRKSAVDGSFYPASPEILGKEIRAMITEGGKKEHALGVVSPHAGYVYSGKVAGEVLSDVTITPTVVVLGVNHRGIGSRASIMTSGRWETPLGMIDIDEALAGRILKESPALNDDPDSHAYEHSLEVQLPFLQILRPDFKLVPITFQMLKYDDCATVASAIAKAVADSGHDVLIVASSDMTHFETAENARRKDELAIDRILDRDPKGLFNVVTRNNISMCGMIPTTIMLSTTDALGAKKARMVRYTNSGEVTGDMTNVVAYTGIIVS